MTERCGGIDVHALPTWTAEDRNFRCRRARKKGEKIGKTWFRCQEDCQKALPGYG